MTRNRVTLRLGTLGKGGDSILDLEAILEESDVVELDVPSKAPLLVIPRYCPSGLRVCSPDNLIVGKLVVCNCQDNPS